MPKVIVQHHVEDYDRWYPVFIEHGEKRRKHGATGHTIHRGVQDPNAILVVNSIETLDGAQAFLDDPSLKEAMGRAGVDPSSVQVWVMEEAETREY